MAQRIIVDTEACQGHGLCYGLLPEVLEMDESGHSRVVCDHIPDSLLDRARDVVLICPEEALEIVDVPNPDESETE